MVEPIDPFEGGIFYGLEAAPRTAAMDDLRLEKAIDGLGESVVVAVADAAYGWFDAGLTQPLSVANRQVLRPADLTAHRTDIIAMIVAEKNRLRTTQDPWIRRNIAQHITTLKVSLAKVEAAMEAVIQEQDDLRDQAARLRQIKGIGPVVSATLIAQLPNSVSLTVEGSRLSPASHHTPMTPDIDVAGAAYGVVAARSGAPCIWQH